jgi:hypothetical protein
MVLYVYHPPSITSPLREKVKVQALEDHIEHQEVVLHPLKDNLAIEQNRMKQGVDHHRNKVKVQALEDHIEHQEVVL